LILVTHWPPTNAQSAEFLEKNQAIVLPIQFFVVFLSVVLFLALC